MKVEWSSMRKLFANLAAGVALLLLGACSEAPKATTETKEEAVAKKIPSTENPPSPPLMRPGQD